MRKNVASQTIGSQMVSASDGSAYTGAVSVSVTKDGGTQAAGGGTVAHEGNGYHSYAPTQAETNADHVAFTFTGSGAVPATVQVYTVSYDPHDTVRLGLTALPNAAAEAAGGLFTRGTAAGQINQDADGRIDSNPVALGGTAQSLTDLKDFADAGYDPASNKVEGVKLVDTTTANTDMRGTDGANTTTPPTASAIASAVWGAATRTLSAGTNIVLAKGTGVTGFNDISVDDIFNKVVEGSLTFLQWTRLGGAALFGKLSGAATTTVAIRDTADTKDRISATVDADGNRSAVTLDGA